MTMDKIIVIDIYHPCLLDTFKEKGDLTFSNGLFGIEDKKIVINLCLFLIIIFLFIFFLYYHIILSNYKNSRKIYPYEQTDNFIGIIGDKYDLGNTTINQLFERNEEIKYLTSLIYLEKNKINKNIFILSGPSGCGKSILIHLFSEKLKDNNDFKLVNCTHNYSRIKLFLNEANCQEDLKQHNIYIFDQSEKLFLNNNRKNIRDAIETIKAFVIRNKNKNNIFIFAVRNEFLSNLIENFSQYAYENKGIIKTNLEANTNEQEFNILYIESNKNNDQLVWPCDQVFGRYAEEIRNFFSDCTLIENQIFLNILESENLSYDELSNILQAKEINPIIKRDILKCFYDRQLCSTNNYWTAIRIVYLLSIGRKYNISFQRNDILRIIHDEDGASLDDCINKLKIAKLIISENNSNNGYEIIHDYIAETFLDYCCMELEIGTRATLDNYINDYCLKGEKDGKDILANRATLNDNTKFINKIYGVSFSGAIIIACLKYYFTKNYNCVISLLPILLSTFYGYKIYKEIICQCWNNIFINLIMPLILSLAIILTTFLNDLWTILLGAINSILIGFPIYIFSIKTSNLSQNSKKYFKGFGIRIIIMGCVIVLVSIGLQGNFIFEVILMTAVIIFGFRTHLNDRFYYSCYGMIHNKNC